MGDGAVRQGSLHETLNLAMLWKLPVVFIVENNGYAMGTSVERTANHSDIWKLGLGYEMPCGPVDGMNPVKVAEALHEAISRARNGDGPSFLEMKTYRYRGHSKSDRNLYRTSDEIEFWKEEKDPLKRFIGKLTEENIDLETLKKIEAEVKEEIRDSVKKALQSPESPKTNLEEDSYA